MEESPAATRQVPPATRVKCSASALKAADPLPLRDSHDLTSSSWPYVFLICPPLFLFSLIDVLATDTHARTHASFARFVLSLSFWFASFMLNLLFCISGLVPLSVPVLICAGCFL